MQENLFEEYKNFFGEADDSDPKEKKERVYTFSPFALQDAVGEKNIKKMWLEYEKLRFADIEAEEIIHKIISKVRDLVFINLGATQEDLGAKDYPYNKSKRDLKNWKEEDLKKFYTKLVEIYHRARMESGNDLDIALEKTLLFL